VAFWSKRPAVDAILRAAPSNELIAK
jgi:hypothetical protein